MIYICVNSKIEVSFLIIVVRIVIAFHRPTSLILTALVSTVEGEFDEASSKRPSQCQRS